MYTTRGARRIELVATIELTQGKHAIVDDEDFEWLSQWKWCYHNGYAVRTDNSLPRRTVLMHREVMKAPDGLEVDHKHFNRLDNRKSELEIVTHQKNQANLPMFKTNKSGFKGVNWDKVRKRWIAFICREGKRKNLGRYDTPEEAAEAYRRAAI